MELDGEQTVSEIQEADTDKQESLEAATACALVKSDITFPHTNEVPQVMNEIPAVSDNEDDEDFDID